MQTFIKPLPSHRVIFPSACEASHCETTGEYVSADGDDLWQRNMGRWTGFPDALPWQVILGLYLILMTDWKNTGIGVKNKIAPVCCVCKHTHIWMRVLHMCKHFQRCQSFSPLSRLFALTTANVAARLITICPTRCLPRCLPLPVFFPLGCCPPVISPGEFILQDSILLFTATHLVIAVARGSCLSSKACGDPPSTLCICGCMLTDALCFTWWGLQMCKPQKRFYTCCG